tara:strand:+ start:653 stop:850 length:198 start_codon:yes stop_codon:yes gene_type:complete
MKNENIKNEFINPKRKLLVNFKEQEKREKNAIGKIRIKFFYYSDFFKETKIFKSQNLLTGKINLS